MPAQPAALSKAQSLARHLLGATRILTAITLSDREAWELLAWYEATTVRYAPPEFRQMFALDLAEAQVFNDPWPMLVDMEVEGFLLTRLPVEVH